MESSLNYKIIGGKPRKKKKIISNHNIITKPMIIAPVYTLLDFYIIYCELHVLFLEGLLVFLLSQVVVDTTIVTVRFVFNQ